MKVSFYPIGHKSLVLSMPRSPLRMWNVYIYTDIQLQNGTWLLNNSDFRDNYKWHYSAFINVLHWTILLITKKSLLEMPLSLTTFPIFLSSFFRNSVYHYPCSEKILCHVCINFADVDQINFLLFPICALMYNIDCKHL